MNLIQNLLPITLLHKSYTLQRFKDDAIAGITVSTVMIPQAIAYAFLANVSANSGLYSAFIAAVIQLFFGRYPFNSFGPAAVVALMVGNSLLSCVYTLKEAGFDTHQDGADRIWEEYPLIIPLNDLLTFSVGISLILFQVFRMSKLFNILMPPVLVASFTSAATLAVMTSQIKGMLGVSIPPVTGSFVIMKTYYQIIINLHSLNWASVLVSIVSFILIFGLLNFESNIVQGITKIWHKITQRPQSTNTSTFSLPVILITIIIMSALTFLTDLEHNFGLKVVGKLQSGLPSISLPWKIFEIVPTDLHCTMIVSLLPNVISIVVILFVSLQSILQAFPFPRESNEDVIIDEIPILRSTSDRELENQTQPSEPLVEDTQWSFETNEIITLSLISIVGSFFQCFTPSSSLSKSALLATLTNATSNIANGVCGLFVGLSILFLAKLIYYIPMACLSAVIISALISTLKKIILGQQLIIKAWKLRDFDSIEAILVWLVTFLGVVLFDPTLGIMMGIFTVLTSKASRICVSKYRERATVEEPSEEATSPITEDLQNFK